MTRNLFTTCASKALRRMLPILMLAAVMFTATPEASCAGATGLPAGTCSSDSQFAIPVPSSGQPGVISLIVGNIQCLLWGDPDGPGPADCGGFNNNNVARDLFMRIANNPGVTYTIAGLVALYVVMYGLMLSVGMVQVSALDIMIRMVKIVLVVALISPSAGWPFFYDIMGRFFNQGTDQLIGQVTAIMMNVPTGPGWNPYAPFLILDQVAAVMTSPRMAVTLLAMFFTGPYGLIFGILILMSLGTFASAVFQAIWIYLMSLVVRAFLFGLAPIFFCFLLFSRTRHLFDGWLNQVVNTTLQPLFLFTFFAFFAQIVLAAMWFIIRVPVCWMPMQDSVTRGTVFDTYGWRFALETSPNSFQPYDGAWSFTGADMAGTPIFPISIMDILMFLLLAQLTWRFNTVVLNIAKDIAGASTSFNMSGALSEYMSRGSNFGKNVGAGAEKAAGSARAQRENTRALGRGTAGDIAKKGFNKMMDKVDFSGGTGKRKDPK